VSSFTEPLEYRSTEIREGGRRFYDVIRGFRYYLGREGSTLFYDVSAGRRTDLGSIPQMFWWWIAPDSPHSSAYVLHDVLYQDVAASRLMCDLILYEALGVPQRVYHLDGSLEHVTMPIHQRQAIFRAVRIGGRRAYQRYADQLQTVETISKEMPI
jgi:hypothetical protein